MQHKELGEIVLEVAKVGKIGYEVLLNNALSCFPNIVSPFCGCDHGR